VKEYVSNKMGVSDLNKEKAFPENNSQINENAEENFKRQFISELNETFITGFPTAQGNLQILKDPGKCEKSRTLKR
jgi:hypothetical protein